MIDIDSYLENLCVNLFYCDRYNMLSKAFKITLRFFFPIRN